MKFLTRREQMVLALVLLAFVAGVGVRHCRAMQGMSGSVEEVRLP